jgi:hypothetical protein
MALAAISHRRRFWPPNLRPAIQPCPSNADHSCSPTSPTLAVDRSARTRTLDPSPPNPHSARGALARGHLTASPHPPSSRFPPLEVFVRRPPECAASFVSGRHPKTFTKADIMQCSKLRTRHQGYSITSSATSSNSRGISRSSDLAVLRLITSSNLVGCSTGRSPGFAPFKTLPT